MFARLSKTMALACLVACSLPVWCQSALHPGPRQSSPRSVTLLDDNWQLLTLPDFQAWAPEPTLTPEQIQGLKIPPADAAWQPVQLPDDYIVRGAFSPEPNPAMLAGGGVCPLGGRECGPAGSEPKTDGHPGALNRPGRTNFGGHGYLPVFPAWYQRALFIPAADKDRNLWLDFGGVYRDAVVFVNGRYIGQHSSGYTGFRFNIAPAVHYGEKNTIAVFVDPRWFEGWWYEGGGIYRHVRLIAASKLQVSPWGTFVKADVPGSITSSPDGDRAPAQLNIATTIRNDDAQTRSFTLVSQVLDAAGKPAGSVATREELAPGKEATFDQHLKLAAARLWSLEHRNLYTLATTLRQGDAAVDSTRTSFGVRTLRFDPEQGFFLNGKHVELRGMCVHQDFPGVGIAAPDNLWQWRIHKLQELGTNAYRTAHNPDADAFYDTADRMGMLVMDETRHLGDTYFPKTTADTPYNDASEVEEMVLQGRNHPSVILWSLANEEGQGAKPYGARIYAAMKQAVKKLDPTRPVSAAVNGGYTPDGLISVEDILGVNYHSTELAQLHSRFPKMMMYGSEDGNAKSSRGTLETSRPAGLCSAYGCDTSLTTGPWRSWVPVVQHPFFAGEFVWTGFDYRGEPNPFSWPAVTSQTGAMDLAGFPKPDYYYWKAVWSEKPNVYIFPAWNLGQDSIGKNVLVRGYSNCDRVELFLNGKSLGAQDMPRDLYLDWNVPYAPGTLTAVGYRAGREVARYTLRTSNQPAVLRLTAQVSHLAANGEDVAPIAVAVLDSRGDVAADAENTIQFSVAGAGTLAGVANGNPASHEPNVAAHCNAYHGLCMVLVKAAHQSGTITVEARSDGLKPAKIVVTTSPAAPQSKP